jgi:hypothetical protein
MADRQHIENLIEINTKNLKIYQERVAKLGDFAPPHFLVEVDRLEKEIQELHQQLHNEFGVPLSDDTNSAATATGVDAKPATADNTTPAAREVYVSYAWNDSRSEIDREEIVNAIEAEFEARGVSIVRDKRDLGFKGSIRGFMQEIGRGKAVVVIISDKYLRSKNCMFELLEIQQHGDFTDRIFPIVLGDAKIYEAIDRLEYLDYWDEKIATLEKRIREGKSLTNINSINRELNLFAKIRTQIDNITDTLQDMNTLTPNMHRDSNFEALYQAVEKKLAE